MVPPVEFIDLNLAILMWVIFFGAFVSLFSKRRPGVLLIGLLRLIASLFVAPLRFLSTSAQRIAEVRTVAPASALSDRQYLLRTLFMISSAAIVLAAIAILSLGAVVSWHAVYPPQLQRERAQLEREYPQLRARLELTERQANEISAQVSGETEQEKRIRQLNERAAQLKAKLQSDRQTLDKSGRQEWQTISAHLGKFESGILQEWQARDIEERVKPFLERIDEPDLRQGIAAYFVAWLELRISEREARQEEARNPRSQLLRQKERLDAEVTQLRENTSKVEARMSLRGFLKDLRFGVGALGLVATFLVFLVFVWLAGLSSEAAELFVDMAINLRLARESLQSPGSPSKGSETAMAARTSN